MDTKNIILSVVKNNHCNFQRVLRSNHISLYNEIELENGKSFSEKCYLYVYKHHGNCIVCGNKTKFISFQKGYGKTCCRKCSSSLGIKTFKNNNDGKNPSQVEEIKDKKKNTFIQKYGVKSPFQLNQSIKNRESSFDKFGGSPLRDISVRNKIRKSKKNQFIDDCKFGHRLPQVKPLFDKQTFTNIKDRNLLFECVKCGHIFSSHLMWGTDPICKICNPASIFQSEIQNFLIENNINIVCNKFDIIENREIDIYIPEKRAAIECNGLYWHSEISGKKLPYYHLQKTKMCHEKGIKLIHVFEDEWIYNKIAVQNRILGLLGNHHIRINARECYIKELSNNDKSKFLNNFHLQGNDSSKIKLGLFHKDELVSVMTFGKSRFSKNEEFELYRFCSAHNVRGGASKLLSHFIKNYNPESIVSYCDIRYSGFDTQFYEKIGFLRISQTKCNYWYIKGNRRFHRMNFQKHKLKNKLDHFNPALTEWENMQLNGYDRIWDCGSIKYKWERKCQKKTGNV